MLTLENICKRFGAVRVLDSVSLELHPASVLCVAGANAQGKTTLLSIAAGMLDADSGTVRCDGSIAFVPQRPMILPELSCKEHLKLWYAAHGKREPIFGADSPETRLGLAPYAKRQAGKLSGGMQQRLSIAGALVANPDYLLLDEPFVSLDAPSAEDLCLQIKTLKESGIGILLVSHELERIAAVADEVVLLHDHRILRSMSLNGLSDSSRAKSLSSFLFENLS